MIHTHYKMRAAPHPRLNVELLKGVCTINKFPYGISDFNRIIKEGFFYVDRTDKILLIEQAGVQLLFLRPRRFGKTLLLSMLDNYYDAAKAEQFEQLFGHLAVGQNPTEKHNQYLVMKWDFSLVETHGDPKEIRNALHRRINKAIMSFKDYYKELLSYEIDVNPDDAISSFESVLIALQSSPYRMYLLIDEYDNFANELMMSQKAISQERYRELLYGEGSLKTMFKAVKNAASGRGLDRVFITGVSPVVMSDITSGYNVAASVYLDSRFNSLCGFSEAEIQMALDGAAKECNLPSEEAQKALAMMRTFYNGYRFCRSIEEPLVYNPTLALYFIQHFQTTCQYPENMLDSNLAMDKGKLRYISELPNGNELITRALNDDDPVAVIHLADSFGVEDMLYAKKDTTFMASLLYFFGILTISGKTMFRELLLTIPNLAIHKLYVEQLQELVIPTVEDKETALSAAKHLYQKGEIQPLCEFIENSCFAALSSRDYRWANELTVKTAFLTTLYNDTLYIIDSETALKRTYADLTMIVRPDVRKYPLQDILIEFKFVSLKELLLSGENVKKMDTEQLKELIQVKEKLDEALAKLGQYREVLEKKYGDSLRLKIFAVVAVGFERLVWES